MKFTTLENLRTRHPIRVITATNADDAYLFAANVKGRQRFPALAGDDPSRDRRRGAP